jgi:hypothetical protein
MKIKQIFTLSAALLTTLWASAQQYPTINPTAVCTTEDGQEETGTLFSKPAPLMVRFYANAENVGGYNATYEWHFTLEGEKEPYLVRYEEDTDYTFTKAGTHLIELYATFRQGTDTIRYTEEYWLESVPIRVTISESILLILLHHFFLTESCFSKSLHKVSIFLAASFFIRSIKVC